MPKGRRTDPELERRVIETWRTGLSHPDIAEATGVTKGSVANIIKRWREANPEEWERVRSEVNAAVEKSAELKRAATRRSRSEERDRRVIEAWRTGMTHGQVAEATGVKKRTVGEITQRWKRENPEEWERIRPAIRAASLQAMAEGGIKGSELSSDVRRDPERANRVVDMWKEGRPYSEIVAATGETRGMVGYYVSLHLKKNPGTVSRMGTASTPGIAELPVVVNGREFENPRAAAEGRKWTAEALMKALSSGLEVLGLDAIALADPKLERMRLDFRGEEAVEEDARHWMLKG